MNKLLFLFGIMAITQGVIAQGSFLNIPDTSVLKRIHIRTDCYLMKDGKMMIAKHGDTTMMAMMNRTVLVNNGATVMVDGTVKLADGTIMMLQEGWYVDMNGEMGIMKKRMKEDKM
jgi:hypothetical protein